MLNDLCASVSVFHLSVFPNHWNTLLLNDLVGFNVYEEKTIYVKIVGLVKFYIRRQRADKKITVCCLIYVYYSIEV